MNVIISKKDGTQVTHNIDFELNGFIDFDFEEKELEHQKLADTMQRITFVGAIPFIRYCAKNAVNLEQAKLMKELFLKTIGSLLDNAMEDDGPIGYSLHARMEQDLYGFMEELYETWLSEIRFTTESLLYDFKDYAVVDIKPEVDLWFTLMMIFENKEGNKRLLPLKLLHDYEEASDEEIKMNATFCRLIAVVILDKLGYAPNPLRAMEDLSAFEEEMLQIVRAATEKENSEGAR